MLAVFYVCTPSKGVEFESVAVVPFSLVAEPSKGMQLSQSSCPFFVDLLSVLFYLFLVGEREGPIFKPPVSKAPPLEADFVAKAAAKRHDRSKSASEVAMLERRDPKSARPRIPGELPEEPVLIPRSVDAVLPGASALHPDFLENPYMLPTDELGISADDPIYEIIRSRRASLRHSAQGRSRSGLGGSGDMSQREGTHALNEANRYRASTLYDQVPITEGQVLILDRIGNSHA